MVSHKPDERPSSPALRRKARTRPPDVTEARASAQRAKLDAQASTRESKAFTSGAPQEQDERSAVQARRRAAATLVVGMNVRVEDAGDLPAVL